jgi:hypothetical protein
MYRLLFSHPNVDAICWWNLVDGDWGGNPGGLVRRNLTPKPSYDVIRQLIHEEWDSTMRKRTDHRGEVAARAPGADDLAGGVGRDREPIALASRDGTGAAEGVEHVDRAVGVKTQRGYALSSQKSSGPITLARCLIFAAALIAKPVSKQRPAIAFSR